MRYLKQFERFTIPSRIRYLLFGLLFTFGGIVELWSWSEGRSNTFGMYFGAVLVLVGPCYLFHAWRSWARNRTIRDP